MKPFYIEFNERVSQKIVNYMKEHSDIDARKYKLNSLMDELVASGIVTKFEIRYSYDDIANIDIWTGNGIIPDQRAAYNLGIDSEDIPKDLKE